MTNIFIPADGSRTIGRARCIRVPSILASEHHLQGELPSYIFSQMNLTGFVASSNRTPLTKYTESESEILSR